jgi:anaerobic selenocysteine-containing dehydrogenase
MKSKEAEKKTEQLEAYDDVWIPTQCRRCVSTCGILAHRVNGVAVKLKGNPDTYMGSKGGICAKGIAGLQLLYDPNRLNVPLRRTNPEKGLNVDPKWQEISWEEALDEIAARLKKAMEEDPDRIFVQSGVSVAPTGSVAWRLLLSNVLATSKGRPHISSGGAGVHCGNPGHLVSGQTYGSWWALPDLSLCNYLLVFGSSVGFANGGQANIKQTADAIARGMKVVVFDPVCNFSGAKATEWIPIVPGTDAAVILAMLNVISNELKIYDAAYLKDKTNGPYLIGADGRYVRDKKTGQPTVWDVSESRAKNYDDPSLGDVALEGIFEVNGSNCRPVWQALREHFAKYTPEESSRISGIPAATIRRIATEFAEAAMVGATITIEGKQLPLRPVAAITGRGAVVHENGTHTAFAAELLNQVLGAADVPGGRVAKAGRCLGYPGTGLPEINSGKGVDGFLTIAGKWVMPHKGWPLMEPKYPKSKDLRDLFVLQDSSPMWGGVTDREEILQKAKVDKSIDVMLNFGCNSVMNMANPKDEEQFLKNIPFIVSFELFATEIAEGFADILLPDACYLEKSDWMSILGYFWNQTSTMEPWCFHITQKVVEPTRGRRDTMDVTLELLDRIGLREKTNEYWNKWLDFGEALKIKPTEKVSWEQLGDRVVRHYFGQEHDWEWFKQHGFISWPRKVEEAYPKCFVDYRVHIYRGYLVDLGEKISKIAKELGIEMDWKQYTPFPEWFPIRPYLIDDPQYDLYCFCYRDPLHLNSHTMQQPWLDEASEVSPYTYTITMNVDTARQKGLKDGDTIEVQSDKGNRIWGVLQTRKAQHGQTVAIAGTAGHWASGLPIARGKGTNFNSVMELRWNECDPITFAFEDCVKVKVLPGNSPT